MTAFEENKDIQRGKHIQIRLTIVEAKFSEFILEHQFYVKCKIDGKVIKTRRSKRKSNPRWDERNLILVGEDSLLELRVYIFHRFWLDEEVGGFKECISNLPASPEGQDIALPLKDLKSSTGKLSRGSSISIRIESDVDKISEGTEPETIPKGAAHEIEESISDVNIRSISTMWLALLDCLDSVVAVLDKIPQCQPYAEPVSRILTAIPKAFFDELNKEDKLVELVTTLYETYISIGDIKNLQNMDSLKGIYNLLMRQTIECGYFIREYLQKRIVQHSINTFQNIEAIIDKYKVTLEKLRSGFESNGTSDTTVSVVRIMDEVKEMDPLGGEVDAIANLNDLIYSDGMRYQRECSCLPATRTQILDVITRWVESMSISEDSGRVLLLTGSAGSGKSAIAHTIAWKFDKQQRLGSSFFCCRSKLDNSLPEKLFSTIAKDLAYQNPQIKQKLLNELSNNKSLCRTVSVQEQFERFIQKPSNGLTIVGPLLIVIDAIDECGAPEDREELIRVLVEKAPELPSNYRLLITAREGEYDIDNLAARGNVVRITMEDIDAETNKKDISLFLQQKLSPFQNELSTVAKDWVHDLTERSGGLFIWASTACRFIGGNGKSDTDSNAQLDKVLSQNIISDVVLAISDLYLKILESKFDNLDSKSMTILKTILGMILVAFQPLSTETISKMCNLNMHSMESLLQSHIAHLGSLLTGTNDPEAPLETLHKSFRDFLITEERSGTYHINLDENNYIMTRMCLDHMNDNLKFNLCSLTDVFAQRSDISETVIERSISGSLSYACQYWSSHLSLVVDGNKFYFKGLLQSFLYRHLLHWIEIMSILNLLREAATSLQNLSLWLKRHMPGEAAMSNLTDDGIQFLQVFNMPLSDAPLQTYISALSFTPSGTRLYKLYQSTALFPPLFLFGQEENWNTLKVALTGQSHPSSIESISFSPDGRLIASGSSKDLCVWDISSVSSFPFIQQFTESNIRSVTFSPNGKYMAMSTVEGIIELTNLFENSQKNMQEIHGQLDTVLTFFGNDAVLAAWSIGFNVWIWKLNIETGATETNKFSDTEKEISLIALSNNGKAVAKICRDNSVVVWDTESRSKIAQWDIGEPEGPEDVYSAVAISRDKKKLACGTENGTVQLWDIDTKCVLWIGRAKHHQSQLRSVGIVRTIAFSPDDREIVSGTVPNLPSTLKCNNLLIWDCNTGRVFKPVSSVPIPPVHAAVFSPDGKYIAAGHDNNSYTGSSNVRIWNVDAGSYPFRRNPLEDEIEGSDNHIVQLWSSGEKGIKAVALSPDGKLLVSQLSVGITVWDTSTGKVLHQSQQGRRVLFQSFLFSQDMKRIAGCGYDGSVWLWKMNNKSFTGKEIYAGQLNNSRHGTGQCSVTFSRDGKQLIIKSSGNEIIWDITMEVQVYRTTGENADISLPNQHEYSADRGTDNVVKSRQEDYFPSGDARASDLNRRWIKSIDGKKLWWVPDQFQGVSVAQARTLVLYNDESLVLFRYPKHM